MKIQQYIDHALQTRCASIPQLFDFTKEKDQALAATLFVEQKIQQVTDDYEEQQRELFAVRNPHLVYSPDFKDKFGEYFKDLQKKTPLFQQGRWVHFPWLSCLVHILAEDDFFLVRTARNKNLINKEEQEQFYNSTVAIGGLSVGSNIAFALALQGGAKQMKLADMDRLALSNTNRILTGVENLGVLKVELVARMLYQINPYSHIELFPEGVNKENLADFLDSVDVMVDEMDNLAVKYLIREQCQKKKIPIVMAADNGDNAVVDVERHDLYPDIPFFHNRMGDVSYDSLKTLDKFGIGRMITKHVGPENVTERMQQSLLEMGKTIVSWPQLGGAALLNGMTIAYCVRKILTNQSLVSDRSLIVMDALLDPTYNTAEQIEHRKEVTEGFKKIIGL